MWKLCFGERCLRIPWWPRRATWPRAPPSPCSALGPPPPPKTSRWWAISRQVPPCPLFPYSPQDGGVLCSLILFIFPPDEKLRRFREWILFFSFWKVNKMLIEQQYCFRFFCFYWNISYWTKRLEILPETFNFNFSQDDSSKSIFKHCAHYFFLWIHASYHRKNC